MGQRIFQDGQAIESFRASNFDSLSAFGEVVDNSIQANAKRIKIKFFCEELDGSHGYQHIQKVVFCDDGQGMSQQDLGSCLQLGWSSRYNSREGIGRFGVGMTLAAIHECRKVEVYSRTDNGPWNYTYVDLDEIQEGRYGEIPDPTVRRLPKEYEALASQTHGTVVVWSKYDRQLENAESLIANARVWMGRTYRYFIWEDGVVISIDGKDVYAIDPLYCRTDKTEFPGDPLGDLMSPISLDWTGDDGQSSQIEIKMSLLPEAFRPTQGSGNTSESQSRHIHLNEGISILRNRREVFYGHIPYWKLGTGTTGTGIAWAHFEEIDRWWGCEIHFDAVLDQAFSVRNIKQGAVPSTDLKRAIKGQIIGTRHTFLEKIRELWAKNRQRKIDAEKSAGSGGSLPRHHKEAERVAKETPTPKGELDRDKNIDESIDEYVKEAGDRYGEEQRVAIRNLFKAQPFSIEDDTWKGTVFFETKHLGGNAVLTYNTQHEFFEYLYSLVDKIRAAAVPGAEPAQIAKDALEVRVCIDLLLIAFAKSESLFSPADKFTAEAFLEDLRSGWGRFLANYIKTRKSELSEQ